jgi:glycerophosphoryl diester phosphodiesterase
MSIRHLVLSVAATIIVLSVAPGDARAARARALEATADLLLSGDMRPFAIAHRGFGENLGTDPKRPIENTVAAVERGFEAGASVVEVDVQLTRDRRVAAYHNDFFADGTCLNALTLDEIQARVPYVPSLEDVLAAARRFNELHPLRGIVIIELKAAAPLCDPDDTQDRPMVSAVTEIIRHMRMTRQVLLTSFSPALIYLAQRQAPDVDRILAISGLQFLTKDEIAAATGQTVTLIDKNPSLGLQWAELGPVERLPGYRSFDELLRTAALIGARVVEADLLLLHSAGRPLVETLQAAGLRVFGFTANSTKDWKFLESLGVDGIYTNDVPMGLRRQLSPSWPPAS